MVSKVPIIRMEPLHRLNGVTQLSAIANGSRIASEITSAYHEDKTKWPHWRADERLQNDRDCKDASQHEALPFLSLRFHLPQDQAVAVTKDKLVDIQNSTTLRSCIV